MMFFIWCWMDMMVVHWRTLEWLCRFLMGIAEGSDLAKSILRKSETKSETKNSPSLYSSALKIIKVIHVHIQSPLAVFTPGRPFCQTVTLILGLILGMFSMRCKTDFESCYVSMFILQYWLSVWNTLQQIPKLYNCSDDKHSVA